ncbi:MAG TPA: hypothetical protein DEA59_11160, partial [Microbacterium sp.]|nr:hypothetical protein [Microbacterium sp.]
IQRPLIEPDAVRLSLLGLPSGIALGSFPAHRAIGGLDRLPLPGQPVMHTMHLHRRPDHPQHRHSV